MSKSSDAAYYLKYGFQAPEAINAIGLTQSERTGQSMGLWKDASAQSRLVSTSCDLLKGVHLDSEIKVLDAVLEFGQTKTQAREYKEHLLKAGLHASETAATFTDFGSGNNYALSSGDIKFSSYNFGANANVVNLEGAYGTINFKQYQLNAAYYHRISDTVQSSSKYYFARAEKQYTTMADTLIHYSNHTHFSTSANVDHRTGFERRYADQIDIQVGQEPKKETIDGVEIETPAGPLHKLNTQLKSDSNTFGYGSYSIKVLRDIFVTAKERIKFYTPLDYRVEALNVNVQAEGLLNLCSKGQANLSALGQTTVVSASNVVIAGPLVFINSIAPSVLPCDDLPPVVIYEQIPYMKTDLKEYKKEQLPDTEKSAGISVAGVKMPLPPSGTAGPITGVVSASTSGGEPPVTKGATEVSMSPEAKDSDYA